MLILNFLIKTCHRIIKFGYHITCLVLVGYFSLGFVSSLGRLRRKSQIRGSDSVPQTRAGRIHRTTITTDLVMKRDVLESWFCECAVGGGNLRDDMSGGCELTSQQGSSVGDNGALAIADADAGLLGLAIDGGLKC